MKNTQLATTSTGPAHVLHWVPGYVTSTGCGAWELQAAADYEAGQPGGTDPVHDAPRDATAGDLAAWAAGQLGYPVELEKSGATISTFTLRPLSIHIGAEPAYYVRPATTQGR
jgi:hypothetical protein